MKVEPPAPVSRRSTRLLHLVVDGNPDSTKSKILDAAFRRLAREGYTALSMREIAREAGVNHALINYHFKTKDQLVIAVLDAANRQLLDRQQRMYAGDGGFAEKWAEARRFYRDDLASGFVRVQAELWAASMSNAELRANFIPRLLAWKKVVLAAVTDAFDALKAEGYAPPAPLTPAVVATWISEFWLGMEFADLIGARNRSVPHEAAMDAMAHVLEWVDARIASKPRSARRRHPK